MISVLLVVTGHLAISREVVWRYARRELRLNLEIRSAARLLDIRFPP